MTAAFGTRPATATAATGPLARLAALLAGHGSALAALGVRVAAAALGYGMQIVLARLLGAAEYGAFAYAWAWLAIAGFSATFGLGQTAVRWLAHYHETGDRARERGFVRWSIATVTFGAALLAAAGYAALSAWPGLVAPAYRAPMLLMLAAVPLFALGDLAEGFARSRGRTVLALVPPYLVRPALLVASLPLMLAAGVPLTATTAMTAAVIATALTAIGQLALTRRAILADAADATPAYRPRLWLASSLPVLVSDIAQLLRQNADLIVLATVVPPDRIALYFAATRVASLLGLVEFAVGAAAGHRFARVAPDADPATLAAVVRQSVHLTFWPTLLAALALAALAPLVLTLFGPAYAAGSTLVTVLAAGYVARAAIGPAEDLLIMRGHSGAALGAQIGGLATAIALGLVLIPVIGAMGAALTAAGALFVTTALLALACRRVTGFWPLPLPYSAQREMTP